MGDLRATELRRALRVTRELAELRQLTEFPQRVSELLRELIPCDHAGYTAFQPHTGRAVVVADPPDSVFPGGPAAFAQFSHQNPIAMHVRRTGDPHARRISDFISRRDLHRTELYQHVYKLTPLEYQLAMPIPSPHRTLGRPMEIVGLSLARVRRDFSDTDRLLLDTLQPTFTATLLRLQDLALLRAVSFEKGRDPRWLLLVTDDGSIAWSSTGATEDLGLNVGARLPPPLLRWLHGQRRRLASIQGPGGASEARGSATSSAVAHVPLTLESPGIQVGGVDLSNGSISVQVRLVREAYPQLDAVHLTPRESLVSISALQSIGLTQRQAAVLQLALCGQASPEIARTLGLSVRTVEKHFEGIYARLGVDSRTQAIVTAMQALRAAVLRLDR